ncbi:unnamed protein product [Owenia fusiformis]|uniref:Alpha-ketoglutarate-dependent dioxygenase alkB homolog 3 n=1 Tax=Owenia fusiformis TaxID=6347 RepID=A0A8J1XI76_OWEFU|nr:unnamed protein product [Owenia fusiformis]
MSADRRRRARVQGGWAAPSAGPRSDRNKPTMPQQPAWTGKTVDQPTEKKFVFQKPEQEMRQAPEEEVITKMGIYDISSGPSGVSRLRYFPNFIEKMEADVMFETLYNETPWQQRHDLKGKDGVQYTQPRLTAWYGELPYTYSGVTWEPNRFWTKLLKRLRKDLEDNTGFVFNSLLCNLYRNEKDSVDWHSDDEKSLGPNPIIASMSFGDQRNFELRKKPPPEENGDYTYSKRVKIPLTSGSLLIMEGSTQEDWQHRVPKEYHDRNARINLTFRVIHPE